MLSAELKENPYVALVGRKHRNLKKKHEKILKLESQLQAGKQLDDEQLTLYNSKSSVEKFLADLNTLQTQLADIAKEELANQKSSESATCITKREMVSTGQQLTVNTEEASTETEDKVVTSAGTQCNDGNGSFDHSSTEESKSSVNQPARETYTCAQALSGASTDSYVAESPIVDESAATAVTTFDDMEATIYKLLKALHVCWRYKTITGKTLPDHVDFFGKTLLGETSIGTFTDALDSSMKASKQFLKEDESSNYEIVRGCTFSQLAEFIDSLAAEMDTLPGSSLMNVFGASFASTSGNVASTTSVATAAATGANAVVEPTQLHEDPNPAVLSTPPVTKDWDAAEPKEQQAASAAPVINFFATEPHHVPVPAPPIEQHAQVQLLSKIPYYGDGSGMVMSSSCPASELPCAQDPYANPLMPTSTGPSGMNNDSNNATVEPAATAEDTTAEVGAEQTTKRRRNRSGVKKNRSRRANVGEVSEAGEPSTNDNLQKEGNSSTQISTAVATPAVSQAKTTSVLGPPPALVPRQLSVPASTAPAAPSVQTVNDASTDIDSSNVNKDGSNDDGAKKSSRNRRNRTRGGKGRGGVTGDNDTISNAPANSTAPTTPVIPTAAVTTTATVNSQQQQQPAAAKQIPKSFANAVRPVPVPTPTEVQQSTSAPALDGRATTPSSSSEKRQTRVRNRGGKVGNEIIAAEPSNEAVVSQSADVAPPASARAGTTTRRGSKQTTNSSTTNSNSANSHNTNLKEPVPSESRGAPPHEQPQIGSSNKKVSEGSTGGAGRRRDRRRGYRGSGATSGEPSASSGGEQRPQRTSKPNMKPTAVPSAVK